MTTSSKSTFLEMLNPSLSSNHKHTHRDSNHARLLSSTTTHQIKVDDELQSMEIRISLELTPTLWKRVSITTQQRMEQWNTYQPSNLVKATCIIRDTRHCRQKYHTLLQVVNGQTTLPTRSRRICLTFQPQLLLSTLTAHPTTVLLYSTSLTHSVQTLLVLCSLLYVVLYPVKTNICTHNYSHYLQKSARDMMSYFDPPLCCWITRLPSEMKQLRFFSSTKRTAISTLPSILNEMHRKWTPDSIHLLIRQAAVLNSEDVWFNALENIDNSETNIPTKSSTDYIPVHWVESTRNFWDYHSTEERRTTNYLASWHNKLKKLVKPSLILIHQGKTI